MKTLRSLLAAVSFLLIASGSAAAQSNCPNLAFGTVLTAAQWNQCFSAKQDNFGYVPVNKAGDTLLGRLTMTPSTTLRAGINISPGVAPTSPVNGDIWTTNVGVFARINGSTVGPLGSTSLPLTTCTNQFVSAISTGGAGTCTTPVLASAQYANQGTTTTVLHGNASGNPTWAAVNLSTEVTGRLGFANLTQLAAFTLFGNPTSGLANGAAFTIGSLTNKASPTGSDILLLQDAAAAGALKYCTISQCISAISAGVISVNSASGSLTIASGAGITVGTAGTTITVTNSSPIMTGGTLGQQQYKKSATAADSGWFAPAALNLASNPAVDCTGSATTLLSTAVAGQTNVLIPPGCTIKPAMAATYTASIASLSTIQSTMTVTAVSAGTLAVGQAIYGSGVLPNTYIEALGTGTGGTGTYIVRHSQTVGSTTIVSGDTLPASVTIRMACGSSLAVPNNQVILILATFYNPGFCQIFNNGGSSGLVLGIASAAPAWWPNGSTAATNAALGIQQAIYSVQAANANARAYELIWECGVYNLTSGITFTPNADVTWDIHGCGSVNRTRLFCRASGVGSCVTIAGTVFNFGISDFKIKDISIQAETNNTGFSVGLQIGIDAFWMNAFHQRLVENVHVSGFFNTNVLLQNLYFLELRRIDVNPGDVNGVETATSRGITIQNTANTVFTGGIEINNSKITGAGHNTGGTESVILIISNFASSGIAGIHLTGNEIYGGAVQLNMTTAAGNISDIWVNPGNQFEGAVPGNCCNGIVGTVTGSGVKMFDIHIDHVYLSGHGHLHPVQFNGSGGASLFGLSATNNFISNPWDVGIQFLCIGTASSYGLSILGNQIIEPQANSGIDAIYVDSCKAGIYSNNLIGSAAIGSVLRRSVVLANGCQYVSATGNNGGGVTSGAATIFGGTCTPTGAGGSVP